jgi:hypothetical protein
MKIVTSISVLAALLAGMIGVAQAASCRAELGAAKVATLVAQCTEVSPATHPPCNADNPCALIISEIKRGCGFFTPGSTPKAPAFCRNY